MMEDAVSIGCTVARLSRRLRASHSEVRLTAAACLGQLGKKNQQAVLALMVALKDDNVHVRKMAALALGDVGPSARMAVPFLRETLEKDREVGVRRRAVIALGEIGGEESLRALKTAANLDPDEGVRGLASMVMRGPRARRTRAA